MEQNQKKSNVFTEAESKADPARIIDHALAEGFARVVNDEGRTLFSVSIPTRDLPPLSELDALD